MAVWSKVGTREGGSFGGLPVRVRADSVFISSLLHTIGLLFLIRAALWNISAGSDKAVLAKLDAGFRAEAQMAHYLGLACLAIILIGLIVVWTGYVRRSRSAWFVMFVIVWLWAFPLFILPFALALVHGRIVLTFSETLYDAVSQGGTPRSVVESVLIFSLMVIALLLPMKRFFGNREAEKPVHRPSAKLVGISVIGILVILVGPYVWIRVGVLYEIPVAELNSTLRLTSPPPPPPPGHIGN
jgi:hypothetical protein